MNIQTSIFDTAYISLVWKIDYFHLHFPWLQCPRPVWPLMLQHFWSSQHSRGVTLRHTVHVHSTSYATISLKWRWIFTNIIRTNSSLSTRVYLAWTLVEYNDLVKKNEECPMALKYCIDDEYFTQSLCYEADKYTNLHRRLHGTWMDQESHPLLRYDWSAVWIGPI